MSRIIIGRVGSAYGVKGWVKIQSFTDPLENILSYDNWSIKQNNHWSAIAIEAKKMHGQKVIVKFKDIDTPEATRLYTNAFISIDREQLPTLQKGEYYWTDLVGLEVLNAQGEPLGVIHAMHETGSNDVIEVRKDKKVQLIPYLDHVVQSIDLSSNTMIVEWDAEF